jgi:hypothetical protein
VFEIESRKLQQLTSDLDRAGLALDAGKMDLATVKSALNGGDGFLDALAAAGTAAGQSDVLEAANAAVGRCYNELNAITRERSEQARRLEELADCRTTIGQLRAAGDASLDLQGRLDTALAALGKAHEEEPGGIAGTPADVAGNYVAAGGSAFDQLFGWMTAFFANPESVTVGPVDIWAAIQGTYEFQPDNPGSKNDWQYVTVVKLSDQSAMWMNKAGANWMLNLTPDRNVLAVGSDCPYYDSYKQAAIHWEGDTVTGISGPGNGLFKRS